ncbi:MAG TPA: nicotinate-nucleotide adenylyltransferase [Burkholderiales bacterium]|nr:nicotinate-nucleotide adenylyltransferase [Burkholderiales bacterium]
MEPIGILGGTFDPIHFGHLRLAEEAADALNLETVRFIPAGLPYHRDSKATGAEHRLVMARLAIADNPRFMLDAREVQRDGPSYTVDTLLELRAELGAEIPIVVLMGTDAFSRIATWHRYRELFPLAHIAILTRAGMPADWLNAVDSDLRKELKGRLITHERVLHDGPGGCIISVPMTPLEISATNIRNRRRAGKSIRYLLPAPVLDYIESCSLYTV